MKKTNVARLQHKAAIIRQTPAHPPVKTTYSQAMAAAQNFLDAGRHDVTAYILSQLADQFKKEPQPLVGLLITYIQYRRFDEAILVADRLLLRFPANASALIQISMLYHLLEDTDKALQYAQKALQLRPQNIQALELMAIINQSLGNSEHALSCYEKAVAIEPSNAQLLFGYARSIRSRAPDAFVARIHALLNRQGLSDHDKALLHFALAWIYEAKDTDGHFHHLNIANGLMRPGRPWSLVGLEQTLQRNRALFQRANIAPLGSHGDLAYRPIFIAALPRSGTTLLEKMLGAHSATCMVGESGAMENALNHTGFEVNPLVGDIPLGSMEDYTASIPVLASQFQTSYLIARAGSRRIIDKSMSNYYLTGMILMAFPGAKIIDLQRHPLDVIYSCYQHHFGAGHNYIYDLKALVEVYRLYRCHMDLWRQRFPDSVLSLRYEDLVTDQEQSLRRVLDFCDLPWEQACMDYREGLGAITTASEQQVRQKLYLSSMNRWQKVRPHLEEVAAALGDFVDY